MHFDLNDVQDRFPGELFLTLVGGTYDFYGVDNNSFCIGVNGTRMVLEAVEDPSDGYRSYFACFKTAEVGKIFFRRPIARLQLLYGGLSTRTYFPDRWDENDNELPLTSEQVHTLQSNFNGWQLVDPETGHVWLTIGTDHGDDYYPCFTFRYQPDPNMKVETRDE